MIEDVTHMEDHAQTFETPLGDLAKGPWVTRIAEIANEHGYFKALGRKHFAAFVQKSDTLLVTFETVQGIRGLRENALPLGWDMVASMGWSHLCLVSDGDTWFRDGKVYGHFDALIDDGFFDDFSQVIFYGAGPCGYAASAFSVASPGARVVAIQPQATLDPRVTEWDDRFTDHRRVSFTNRYGYAPDMLDAADAAFVFYDSNDPLDAMHAALFTRPNVSKFRMRFMGAALQSQMMDMNILFQVISKANAGKLDTESFAKMYRARRDNRGYLRTLMAVTDRDERFALTRMICKNVTSRTKAPRFARRLAELDAPLNDAHDDAAGTSPQA